MAKKESRTARDVPHHGRQRNVASLSSATERRARIAGENGSMPQRHGGQPKPPAFFGLYDVLDDISLEPEQVFGQYPKLLIGKMLPWLDCTAPGQRGQILHVCSGSLRRGEGIRVDVRAEAAPDIRADGRALPLRDGCVRAVMLDPPYTEHYARELYQVEYPRPKHLLAEAARVVRPGGFIAFVHYTVPAPPPGARFVKLFGLSTGFGFPMRAVTIYQREQDRLL